MAPAKLSTACRGERYSASFMPRTIADAIADSNSDLANSVCYYKINRMAQKQPLSAQALKLKELVDNAGGPAAFAQKYSRDEENDPINPTYVSQIINGSRAFGDKSRQNMARKAGLADGYFETINEARSPDGPAYSATTIAFNNVDEQEVIGIMRAVDNEAKRNILAAARLAEIEYRLRHQKSLKRAGQ